nr:hypothetical protein [Tanacetum cinerariifolium]
MDGKDVVVDDNKDEDEHVEPVDDGMDGKDVVVDDNKDEDENVELVDEGMDVDAYDNKDDDENVEPVDDCMDGKDVVVDDNKDEDENVELVDDGMDVHAYDIKDEDKDVEFVVTITRSHKSKLRLPIDFVASAGIESKENITMKSFDGNETQMSIRTDKQRHRHRSKQYHLSVGWPAFKRSNNISEGDECVFMYATSEDKMCLAKITKKENVHVDDNTDEDEYVELVDGMDDKDVNEDAELVDDEDPFFRVTITPSHKSMLPLPLDFVGLAGINTKKNIIIKSLDGNESQMAVRTDQRFNSAQYHLAMGWVAFKQRNNLSLCDECVFKYITSEDKLCLAKVTKTTEADADPFFVVTITPSHRSSLWLPIDFAGLAGIDTKKNIIVKSLDGNEAQIALRSCPFKKKQRYCFSIGWPDFKRSNNISVGNECVFKYITSEDKMCLAEVVKRKRGRLPPSAEIKLTAAENVKMRSRRPPPVEITVAEAVKRKRGQPPPSSPRVAKDVKSKKGRAAV